MVDFGGRKGIVMHAHDVFALEKSSGLFFVIPPLPVNCLWQNRCVAHKNQGGIFVDIAGIFFRRLITSSGIDEHGNQPVGFDFAVVARAVYEPTMPNSAAATPMAAKPKKRRRLISSIVWVVSIGESSWFDGFMVW